MNKHDLVINLDVFITELRLMEKSDRTLTKYKTNCQKLINFIQHDNEITKEDIIEFKKMILNKDYKPSTINSIIISINKYIKYLGAKDLKVLKIKTQQKSSLEAVISMNDYNRLLRFSKRLGYEDVYLIMKVITTTGIRISELQFFTVESIADSYYIHIRNKGKDRDIIMTKELSRELKRYCRDHKIKAGKIFTLNESTVWRRMKRIAGAARVNKDYVHAHSFRHLFAKEFMSKYNNVLELADILGHSKLETTRIYTMTTKEEKRKKLETMGKKEKQHDNTRID